CRLLSIQGYRGSGYSCQLSRSRFAAYCIHRRIIDCTAFRFYHTTNQLIMDKTKEIINNDKAVIDVDKVSKSFGDRGILHDVDMQLFEGETLVVLGRSGTGTSVLIKLISGLLKPDSGTINVLGEVVNDLSERDLMK